MTENNGQVLSLVVTHENDYIRSHRPSLGLSTVTLPGRDDDPENTEFGAISTGLIATVEGGGESVRLE